MALGALIAAYQEDDSGSLRALLPLAALWQGEVPRPAAVARASRGHPEGVTIQHPLSVYEGLLTPQVVG